MTKDDLGPMPEPTTDEPELVPGGTDAVEPNQVEETLGRDLMPEDNPVDDEMPDEITEPDDKSQAPDGADEEETATAPGPDVNEPNEEPPAGQEAEDGSVEPPA